MSIVKFFNDHEIFITGGSGFIGKALIYKLLRSFPGIGKIYVLLRGKKNKCAQERLEAILASSVFNQLRNEQPGALAKVFAIEGDCSLLGLGISAADLERLQNVTIIYHAAASVRFDDDLKNAILLNTRGTYELVKIAQTMKRLQLFMHVSTTYCNPDKHVVEEKVYPPYADWRTTIKIAEAYDTEILNILNPKYSDHQPNTYTFTKSLAEQIIWDHKDKLPLLIYRPSIVISSMEEPVPGWTDNFNGPLGLLVACGIGILRTNYGDPSIVSDFVPVDVVVRGMIVATYKLIHHGQKSKDLDVINCASSNIRHITLGDVIEIGKKVVKDNPFEVTLWLPDGNITRCYVWNLIRFITLHILVAIILDSAIRFSGKKPFLLKLQRRIYAANLALHVFLTTMWDFKNENFHDIMNYIPKHEMDKFGCLQYAYCNYETFFRNGVRGAKEFLLNEPPDCSRGAMIRMKIYTILHYSIQGVGTFYLIRFLMRYFQQKYNV